MAGIQPQIFECRFAYHRRAVRGHWTQSGPERSLFHVAAAREQIAHDHLQRLATRLEQLGIKANDLRHAANADTVVKAGNRDFIGLIKDRGYRRPAFFNDRNGQRVALQRINWDIHQPFEHGGRVRTKSHHVSIGFDHFVAALHADNAFALFNQAVYRRIEAELHARLLSHFRQPLGKQLAVAGFIVGQAQAAGQLMGNLRQRRFNLGETRGFQQLIRHPRIFQHGDIAGGVLILLGGAEQLQRSALTALVGNTGGFTQGFQTVAAVLRQAHHPPFVFHIVSRVAVAQHLPHPLQLETGAVQANRQRRMALEHPFNRLKRHARCRPGRGIARRDLPGVGGAGLERRTGLTVDNRYLMPRLT